MKLTSVTVQNYRSFPEKVELRLTEGMNTLVGPNNCGKSNFLRAVGMALDPDYPFEASSDVPGQRKFAFPRTTLLFHCEGKTSSEKTLLRYARSYEQSLLGTEAKTYADDGQIRLIVTYRGNQNAGMSRQEYLGTKGVGDRRGDPELNAKAIQQLRKVVRFATIDTGESLASVLNGKFRDILHGVLKEHMKEEFANAAQARETYIAGLQDDLLTPMRDRLLEITRRLFPEVCEVGLLPTVSDIDETLSDVEIRIRDSVDTSLQAKGMGLTGTVLIALLRYLADASKQSLIFAIEEPEAFLHPAAQESLRDDLEALGEREDVTLLVTTHSPFIVSRADKAQVVAIAKSPDGSSRLAGAATGSDPQATALSGLFRDSTIPDLLDRTAAIPDDVDCILLVEGTTDERSLRKAAKVFSLEEEFDRIHIMPAGGTDPLVAQAVLLRAESGRHILALVDSDDNGRKARDMLRNRFNVPKEDVLEYGKFLNGLQDAEGEWLYPAAFMEQFVSHHGEQAVLKSKVKHGGQFRYDFTPEGKELFPEWVDAHGDASNMSTWKTALDTILARVNTLSLIGQ